MALYKLTLTDIVLRTTDNLNIPNDTRNAARQQYNAWVAAGNTPDTADPPTPPPPAIDYGTDVPPRDALVDTVAQLHQFLGQATPTNAQVIGALKLLIRMVLFLSQRLVV
jgi:hypothetical protein